MTSDHRATASHRRASHGGAHGRVRAAGLSEGEFDVLATLRRAGTPYECAPGERAQFTMVTTGAMTKRLDRLVGAGLVTRRRSEHDGRARVVARMPRLAIAAMICASIS